VPGAVARVNLLRPAFHPFVPLALAAFAAKTAFLTAAPLLLLPLSVSALDSESAQSEWDALLRSLQSPESRSHLGRIRLPQDAEACIQAAGTPRGAPGLRTAGGRGTRGTPRRTAAAT